MQNHYFDNNGYYTYSGYANPDNACPLTATRTAPEKKDGKHPKWNGEAWGYVQDKRGTKYYLPDGSEHEITEVEGQLPDGASLTKPEPEPPTVEELTAQKHKAAQAEKVRAVNAGCVVDGVLFDSDQAAKIAYLGLERKFRDNPSYVKEGWKASLGVWVDMNAALFLQVVNAVEQHESDCFAWQKAKDDEIDAAAKQGLAKLEAVTIEYQPAN